MNPSARTAAAFSSYLLVAIAFSWPIPTQLRTHLPTPADGDTAVYVWNVWVFHHELAVHGHLPLETTHILAPAASVPLVFHNYTIYADLLAYPFVKILGVVGAFNLVHLAQPALAAFTMFLLARHICGRLAAAWLAGLVFGFSPFVLARGLGHFSLAAAAPLPLFTLCALRAVDERSPAYGAAAGAAMAWAALCDPYYAIDCLLVAMAVAVPAFVRAGVRDDIRPSRTLFGRIAIGFAIGFGVLALAIALTGGWSFRIFGTPVSVQGLYTPVLLATLAAVTWILVRLRVEWREDPPLTVPHLVGVLLAGAGACTALLLPMVPEIARAWLGGHSPAAPVYWRSSAPGVDLLAFLLPNPVSPLVGGASRTWLQGLPNGFVENTASLPLVALFTIGLALRSGRYFLPRFWTVFALASACLSLGPFVHIAGVNTYIPGPWALVRYLPIVGLARMPGRLAVLVVMALAVIFSLAVAWLLSSRRRPRVVLVVISAALLLELSPLPRQLYETSIPSVYEVIRRDTRDVPVLELPVGLEDGLTSVGAFSPAAEFFQTFHEKRIFGGYISRIPPEIVAAQTQDPLLSALFALSDGREPPRDIERPAITSDEWPGYVVMETGRTSNPLRQFAIEAFNLELVASDAGRELYRPRRTEQ